MNFWSTFALVLSLLFCFQSNAAETYGFKKLTKNKLTADWVVTYSQDSAEQGELIDQALSSPGDRAHLSLVAREKELPTDIEPLEDNEALIEYELPADSQNKNSPNSQKLTKGEKKSALLIATAQSALTTFSFIYFSTGSLSAASVASLLSTALTFYYTWDPMRFGRYLEWSKDKLSKLASFVGLKKLGKSKKFGEVAKLGAVAAASVFFSYLYGGVLAWDQFLTQFTDVGFHASNIYKGFLGVFFGGIWSSVFTGWETDKNSSLTKGQVRGIWRAKSLFASILGPMIYLDILPAQILAGVSGLASVVALWKPTLVNNVFSKSINFTRNKARSIKNRFKSWFTGKTVCDELLFAQ